MEEHYLISLLKREKKIRIYGPLLLFIFLLVFFYAMVLDVSTIAARWILIPFFYSVLSWESARVIVLFSRKKLPGIRNTRKRISLIIFGGIPLAALVGYIDHQFTYQLNLYKKITLDDYFFITGLNILCNAIAISFYESHYYLLEWKMLFRESEDLKKQNSNSQFLFLREQIKPHFLFNSLNTLSALIVTDPPKAELYVEEMSTVYRYLLTKNEKVLTTLGEELSFLDSYLLLLKVRFEDSLNVEINTAENLTDYLLPPFVLQLLIENAVKHNVISTDHPLTIKIFTDKDKRLHVENNLQLKSRVHPSEQKGLMNIQSRYALLNQENGFVVCREDAHFRVTIPLFKSNRYSMAHLLND